MCTRSTICWKIKSCSLESLERVTIYPSGHISVVSHNQNVYGVSNHINSYKWGIKPHKFIQMGLKFASNLYKWVLPKCGQPKPKCAKPTLKCDKPIFEKRILSFQIRKLASKYRKLSGEYFLIISIAPFYFISIFFYIFRCFKIVCRKLYRSDEQRISSNIQFFFQLYAWCSPI